MTSSQFRQLRMRLARLVLTTAGAVLIFWTAATIVTERAVPFAGPLLPASASISASGYERAVARARDHIQAMMLERQIPGLSVAVAVKGVLVWSEAFGYKWAAGGFLSTAEDLVRFGSAHMAPMNKGFLKPETLELLFAPRTGPAGVLGYGLGWMTARDLHLRRAHFQFGAASGGTSVFVIYPEQSVCMAIVCNLGHARFPFARLMGVVNPFLSDPAKIVLRVVAVFLLAGGMTILLRCLNKRNKALR